MNTFLITHEESKNVNYLSESLKKFLTYCKSEKIHHESIKSIKEREEDLIIIVCVVKYSIKWNNIYKFVKYLKLMWK